MKEHILVIEDEPEIRELIRLNLTRRDFRVSELAKADNGTDLLRTTQVDLIVLDVMLPGIDGFEFCRQLKADKTYRNIPVIMLTARGEAEDMVAGLEIGADDYLTKPFSVAVLIARIRALLRRKRLPSEDDLAPVSIGDLVIHPGRYQVIAGGSDVDLTVTEFQILLLLARSPGWVYSRYQIVDKVRGEETITTDRLIDVHIANLRKKLGTYGECIQTIRGVGYKFRPLAEFTQ